MANTKTTDLAAATVMLDTDVLEFVSDPGGTPVNKKITGANFFNRSSYTMILPQAASPAQTAEGSVVWDTDDNKLTIGDGASRQTLLNENMLTTRGDTFRRGASGVERVALGAAGTIWRSDGTDAGWAPAEMDYAQITADASITATVVGSANTVISGASVTYEALPHIIEFYTVYLGPDTAVAGRSISIYLFVDGSVESRLGIAFSQVAGISMTHSVTLRRRYTPTAGAHTFSIRAIVSAGTGSVGGGAGGGSANAPAYLRVTRA